MIKAMNLQKNYGSFHLNISLEVAPGRVTGLVGRNGMGKSTTIKAILGLIEPDGGTVTTLGTISRKLSTQQKEQIGAGFSDSGFSGYFTIEDIRKILKNMYSSFDEPLFRKLCTEYGLPAEKRIRDFSTGMKAKLRVLIACTHNAKLLVLDEPTSGLDVIARREVLDLIRDYLTQDPERSLLISSHISTDLEGLCDDIYMIHNGTVVLHEDTDVLLGEYAVIRVSKAQFGKLDRTYLISVKEEPFGYSCFTNQRQYYLENYPELVIESGNIDELIIMMSEGGNVQ